ncbi:hypothetical protein MLD52_21700 [Puniceicoccaceae bacterium K14]|nr:hypothetical protein [Puniceicoccaceae bacterium K14]
MRHLLAIPFVILLFVKTNPDDSSKIIIIVGMSVIFAAWVIAGEIAQTREALPGYQKKKTDLEPYKIWAIRIGFAIACLALVFAYLA